MLLQMLGLLDEKRTFHIQMRKHLRVLSIVVPQPEQVVVSLPWGVDEELRVVAPILPFYLPEQHLVGSGFGNGALVGKYSSRGVGVLHGVRKELGNRIMKRSRLFCSNAIIVQYKFVFSLFDKRLGRYKELYKYG